MGARAVKTERPRFHGHGESVRSPNGEHEGRERNARDSPENPAIASPS